MKFRTEVAIAKAPFAIEPREELLFVGSCFADSIGRRCEDDKFQTTINPFGVMYNPASILHTIERLQDLRPAVTLLTLGTNHVYILKETGAIVDNCQKRPHNLFREQELSVGECAEYLRQTAELLLSRRPDMRIVITVSPIRYAKYGYHGSRLSKATLLLAAHQLCSDFPDSVYYFPAYEIMNDELRDYRFYAPDMLHPSEQAADYIYERFADACFSAATQQFLAQWRPLRAALAHRPFHPDSEEYKVFIAKTREKTKKLLNEERL